MNTINRISLLRAAITNAKQAGKRISFVPTMGNLHQGHLDLVKRARNDGDFVVVSIYVNPLQFGENEDLSNYPRTERQDATLLAEMDVDVLFLPDTTAMYPGNIAEQTMVDIPSLSGKYCGMHRPIHFRGVTTVVARLFNIVQPNVAVFGKKDYQQLFLIKKMVNDLAFQIEVIGVETARHDSGLAMSSRNAYLTQSQLKKAPTLYQELQSLKQTILAGDERFQSLIKKTLANLKKIGFDPHYVNIVSQDSLLEAQQDDKKLVILAAAQLGKARLIDNIEMTL